jgi:hypothetical protein
LGHAAAVTDVPALVPRAPVSFEQLLAGAADRHPFGVHAGKTGAQLERLVIDSTPHVLKLVHVDEDWVARTTGDLRCRPLVAWQAGLLDALPATVDPAIVGVAGGLGRNG